MIRYYRSEALRDVSVLRYYRLHVCQASMVLIQPGRPLVTVPKNDHQTGFWFVVIVKDRFADILSSIQGALIGRVQRARKDADYRRYGVGLKGQFISRGLSGSRDHVITCETWFALSYLTRTRQEARNNNGSCTWFFGNSGIERGEEPQE